MGFLSDKQLPENPLQRANIISKVFFCFTLPLFWKSRKKVLTKDDLYQPLDEHKSEHLGDLLSMAWDRQREKSRNPKLLDAILRVFGKLIASLGLFLFLMDFAFRLTQPIFIGMLVSRYSASSGSGSFQLYLYAVMVILCSALTVIFNHSFMLSSMHCGMKIRVALASLIYRKCLRLSQAALINTTTGKILNLLSNDIGKIDNAMHGLHQIWVGPLDTIAIMFLVYYQIGFSAVAGICVLSVFSLLQMYMGRKISEIRARIATRSDDRIRLMNEIIQGIQVIKMYAWEKPFGKLIALARKQEMNSIRHSNYIRGFGISTMMFVTRLSIFSSLAVYAIIGQILTAEKAFVVTAYYNILRHVMTVMFPRGIEQLGETRTSLRRIENFLLLPEKGENLRRVKLDACENDVNSADSEVPLLLNSQRDNGKKKVEQLKTNANLLLQRVSAKWNPEESDLTLDGISFAAQAGDIVCIIGPVGSGKSSILQAILGELPLSAGSIVTDDAVISYASQVPWIFNGTIQENIVFGQELNANRYQKVVEACSLISDFESLPHGDQTLVGDRGQMLSGGQKARINLARAIYRQADIYLLDDPLSAVDIHVGRKLIRRCIGEYLRNSLVVLVTHQTHLLDILDSQIVVLSGGKIEATGTFLELKEIMKLMDIINNDGKEEDNDNKEPLSRVNRRSVRREISQKNDRRPAPVQNVETQKTGGIEFSLYQKYVKLGGGFVLFTYAMIFCVATQLFASGGDYFIAFWVNYETRDTPENQTTQAGDWSKANTTADVDHMLPVYIFTGITLSGVLITIYRTYLMFEIATKASIRLHDRMYHGVVQAAMYFFNTNPVGRILNRFTKDMGQIDESLPAVSMEVIQIVLAQIGVIVVVAIVNAWSLIWIVAMAFVLFFLRQIYLKTSLTLRRMDAVARSPLYSHMTTSMLGLSTIRASSAEDSFRRQFDRHQDSHTSIFFSILSTERAFGFYSDTFCITYIVLVTFLALHSANAGHVGLAITQAIGITGLLQYGLRQSAQLENIMTAVERVVEYETIEPEESGKLIKKPPPDWPNRGHIKFTNLSLHYSRGVASPKVLEDINLEIQPNEKIGIVGRTGAGKSSLINALFRLAFNEGSIQIDDEDIECIALETIRKRISIIPQEPVLFSRTLRYNLDPFDEYTDSNLWQALEEVQLKTIISKDGLNSQVTEGGTNYSVGQRQLICLARAILRDNRILVVDEATAHVDRQTDAFVQKMIREKFKNCTVLTVAHRLHTVMDSDKIVVMREGHVMEFDEPYSLMTKENSMLHNMAEESGHSIFADLLRIAKVTYEKKHQRQDSHS